jgi:hypothetical protein
MFSVKITLRVSGKIFAKNILRTSYYDIFSKDDSETIPVSK